MKVCQATIADLDDLVPLFDAYRQFYGQSSDKSAARAFLEDRLEHGQSVILIAIQGERNVGFAQLYPSFSSVRLSRTFILNDLFVAPDVRATGVGRILLDASCTYGRQVGAAQLSLSTAVDNASAQALYERAGWTRDTEFYAYDISLL